MKKQEYKLTRQYLFFTFSTFRRSYFLIIITEFKICIRRSIHVNTLFNKCSCFCDISITKETFFFSFQFLSTVLDDKHN